MLTSNLAVWTEGEAAPSESRPLCEDLRVDVAVVGGGFNGLSAAWHLKRSQEGLNVAVLEGGSVGDGPSGRNSGFVMSQFGLHLETIKQVYGRMRALEAFDYASRSLEYARTLVTDHRFQSDTDPHAGIMRIAIGDVYVKELERTHAYYSSLGRDGTVQWVDSGALSAELQSPLLAGSAALFEPNMMFINPFKHVKEWKRLAEDAGVLVFERSPVFAIDLKNREIVLRSPQGSLAADKVVLATNGFSHTLPGSVTMKNDQLPLKVYGLATEPLTTAQWEDVGWRRRCGLQTTSAGLPYSFRPTSDGRIHFGGRALGFGHHGRPPEHDVQIYDMNERDFRRFFPVLHDIRITHRWSGVVSATIDLVPHIGFVDEARRVLRLSGCWGHGVSMAHLNGQLVADLLCGISSDLTELWFVRRKPRRWPPASLGRWGVAGALGLTTALDSRMLRRAIRSSRDPQRRAALVALSHK